MAICPFLSWKQKSIDRPPTMDITSVLYEFDISAEVVNSLKEETGTAWPKGSDVFSPTNIKGYPVSVAEQISLPAGYESDTINYETDDGSNGKFDSNGFFMCFQSTSCQLWDDQNSRCGLRSSDFLNNNSVELSETAVTNLLKGVVGKYSERDITVDTEADSLLKYLQKMFGKKEDRDNSIDAIYDPFIKYLQKILGKKENRDGTGASTTDPVLTYLTNVLGSQKDRDSGTDSLLLYLRNLIGEKEERETDLTNGDIEPIGEGKPLTLLRQFIRVLGSITDLDVTELHQIGSKLKIESHLHNVHEHIQRLDPEHKHPPREFSILSLNLVLEFMTKYDADYGTHPDGTDSSIYGEEWMITEDTDCPPVISAIHRHREWVKPDIEITWDEYVELYDETIGSL